MKTERIYPFVTVTKKGEKFLKEGHVWVYGEEITSTNGDITNGCVVDVFSEKHTYLGSGLYSELSKIKVRILSTNANDTYDESFFARRVKYAISYRKTVMRGDLSSCRLIFGEADGLPGVTADKFSDIVVFQILSYGMEQRKDVLYRAIVDALRDEGETVNGIFERNDVAIRKLEGLEENKGWADVDGIFHPIETKTQIVENGIKYTVDFENGQKTGFFLDQKFNRAEVARIALGKTVLDCFTHTGSFALNAAMGGAAHVTAVDISEKAIEDAKTNAALNRLDSRMSFVAADVFDYLTELKNDKNAPKYDFIILDPPAFTKSRQTVRNAEKGYKEINKKAMQLLPRGGYLATCSCSHFMRDDLFRKMLADAANEASVTLKQIEARQQACDHPILMNVPETDYLKFYIFQIV